MDIKLFAGRIWTPHFRHKESFQFRPFKRERGKKKSFGLNKIWCCGSGSGIRCLFDPWIRDPVWVKIQGPRSGSGMNIFLTLDPGFGMEKFASGMEKFGSGIRDKHPGFATLPKLHANVVADKLLGRTL